MKEESVSVFSKIINREIPAEIVYETDTLLAFKDVNPQAPVHILLIPKKPLVNLDSAAGEDQALLGELLLAAAEIAKENGLTENGYRVVINNGKRAGQTVFHLHAHILGGREMHWPPG